MKMLLTISLAVVLALSLSIVPLPVSARSADAWIDDDGASSGPSDRVDGYTFDIGAFATTEDNTDTLTLALYEKNYSANSRQFPHAAYWEAQTFTPSESHVNKSVRLWLQQDFSGPGNVTVSIRATDGSGHPTGSDLCSGTIDGNTLPRGSWEDREITFGAGYTLNANTKYAIVVRCQGTYPGCLHWRMYVGDSYTGGNRERSPDSGRTWHTESTHDFVFEEWGSPLIQNTPPVADDQSVATDEDTAVSITLTASDVDNDPLTYSVVEDPANGSLSGTPPNLTYTPDPNFNGSDSFTFKANDGEVDSNIATVSITVNPGTPTAYVTIEMSKQSFWFFWRVTATVTIREGDDSGLPLEEVTVNGHWSGAYSGTVSGKTDKNGNVSFRTRWRIRTAQAVTFTVDEVVKNGQEYRLTGETEDSITGGSSRYRP